MCACLTITNSPSVQVNINFLIKSTTMRNLDTHREVLLTFTTSSSKGLSITLRQLRAAEQAVMNRRQTGQLINPSRDRNINSRNLEQNSEKKLH